VGRPHHRHRASAKLRAPAESAAVAAAASSRRRSRKRRQQQSHKYDHADATIDLDPDWDALPRDEPVASTVGSDRGAGSLGFAGTVSKDSEQATGFATLPSDDFGGGPNMPMLPHTWTPKDGKDIP
jgi:PPE-repeat protein